MNPTVLSAPCRQSRAPSARRGFSLIEVLIATVIALAASLAIFQSFAVSEGYRRAATAGGDATFAGGMGAFVMEQDLAQAGYGINTATYLGCATSGVDITSGTARAFAFSLAPALIQAGAGPTIPDQLTIVASNTAAAPGPVPLSSPMVSPIADIQVTNPFGLFAGDVYVLAQAGQACVVGQATDTPTANPVGSQNTVRHGPGSYRTIGGTNAVARYNTAAGWGPAYNATAVLIDMGAAPIVNRYYIANNTLMVDQIVAGQFGVPVAGNIVQMKALYGRDTVGAGTVTTWDTATPANSAQWAAVLAIRVAIAARSAQPEKPNAAGACTTTLAPPSVRWEDGTTTVLDVSATANWQCYHYKLFRSTASLRNQIWTPS
jgi:type IV pilus assembly protein PilW